MILLFILYVTMVNTEEPIYDEPTSKACQYIDIQHISRSVDQLTQIVKNHTEAIRLLHLMLDLLKNEVIKLKDK